MQDNFCVSVSGGCMVYAVASINAQNRIALLHTTSVSAVNISLYIGLISGTFNFTFARLTNFQINMDNS